jgi:hypothetical protein
LALLSHIRIWAKPRRLTGQARQEFFGGIVENEHVKKMGRNVKKETLA